MNDIIYRQAALDSLSRGSGCGTSCHRAIKALPSAQRWVPCSERMPKMGEDVLVWLKEKDPCGKNLRIAYIGFHSVENEFFEYLGDKLVWYSHVYYYDMEDVIAWMPCPEPYVESDEQVRMSGEESGVGAENH